MMSWWKDVLFSWWLILCHFFGFQSIDESTLNRANIPQASFFQLPDVYENFVNPDPNTHRIKNTCQDKRFLEQVRALQSPANRSECNTPSTRQVWCKNLNQNPFHICYDYERPAEQKIPVPHPNNVDGTKKVQLNFGRRTPIHCRYIRCLPTTIPKVTIEISYGTVAPDGYVKENAMLINGTYPGPLIEAYWGQTIELTVINNLGVNKGEITNGTAIHPHGLRLWDNAIHDGVPGVTQCKGRPLIHYSVPSTK
ncbi:hypothetical protein TWF730_003768 [Orbilia blumenaviensis]|uniref:Plastocyanin-like domain-containing protein n=1 Tax=Orbilia blumenaviensis TaxID=1796055 RepID=A0AAV9U4I5_9PEZI